jgi:hypothetical protein
MRTSLMPGASLKEEQSLPDGLIHTGMFSGAETRLSEAFSERLTTAVGLDYWKRGHTEAIFWPGDSAVKTQLQ